MAAEKANRVHLCCVIPYRYVENKVEYCLLLSLEDRAWNFPQTAVPADACGPEVVAEEAQLLGGLYGVIDSARPLGQYASSRGGTKKEVTAFLMQVTRMDDQPVLPRGGGAWPPRPKLAFAASRCAD